MTAVLVCFSHEIVVLIFSKAYVDSVGVFTVYLLLLPFRSISYGAVCIAAGRNDLVRKGAAIGLVANIVLTCILIPTMGYIGAAIATVVTTGLIVIPYYLARIAEIFELPFRQIVPWGYLLRLSVYSAVLWAVLAGARSAVYQWLLT